LTSSASGSWARRAMGQRPEALQAWKLNAPGCWRCKRSPRFGINYFTGGSHPHPRPLPGRENLTLAPFLVGEGEV
jgi:hypothetical protein